MDKIKKIARGVIKVCGINNVARAKTRHMPRIIMYHGFCNSDDKDLKPIPVDQFRKHLKYIKKHFYPLKISELLLTKELKGSYPENAVAITIDDGYENFYYWAFPILKELDIPATVFVVADLTEKNEWMWPDKFHYIISCLKDTNNGINADESGKLLSGLKKLTVNKRNEQLKEISEKYNISLPSEPPHKYKLMSWEQLRDLKNTGLIEIGSHSCTHPIMSHLNYEESLYEINESKSKLNKRLNIEVSSFCYPNGQKGDYLDKQKKMLSQAGYLCGVASHFGYVSNSSDKYSLPRMVGVQRDFNLFAKFIDGVEYLQRKGFT